MQKMLIMLKYIFFKFNIFFTNKMNKHEKMRSSLLCQLCCLIYENPVKLPCNKSICKAHLFDSNGTFLKEFECQYCQTTHFLPMRGLHPNFQILKTIKENVHLSETELDLKIKLEKSYEKLSKVCGEINEAKIKFSLEWSDSKLIREQKLLKLKNNLTLEFRQIKINTDFLQQQYLDIEDEACFLRQELENLILNETQILAKNVKIISCYEDGSIGMRDFQDSSQFTLFDGKHDGSVNCLLVTLDNQKLISGAKDGSIKIWDIKTGLLLKSILNSTPNNNCWNIKCMANSPQSNEILIGSTLSDIRVLDLNTFEFNSKHLLKGHSRAVTCLEFLSHECLLSSCDASIKIWNFKLKQCVQTLKSEWCEQVKEMRKINAYTFVCGYKNLTIRIWSCHSNGSTFECVKFMSKTSDGSCLLQIEVNLALNILMCCSDRSIFIRRLNDLMFLNHFRLENNDRIRSFEILTNNNVLVGANSNALVMGCVKSGKSLKVIDDYSCLINQIKIWFP